VKKIPLPLPDLYLIENEVFKDSRGSLSEVYKDEQVYDILGFKNVLELEVVSVKGVLRGLHYQLDPYAQAKIVRVVNGKILDIVVDIRKSSKTFGKWCSYVLGDESRQQLYSPRGFAHGYYTIEDNTKIIYKLDNIYDIPANYLPYIVNNEAFKPPIYNDKYDLWIRNSDF
jgi:dTDP-4-dehydrorhamnose 3,5-epimerase